MVGEFARAPDDDVQAVPEVVPEHAVEDGEALLVVLQRRAVPEYADGPVELVAGEERERDLAVPSVAVRGVCVSIASWYCSQKRPPTSSGKISQSDSPTSSSGS